MFFCLHFHQSPNLEFSNVQCSVLPYLLFSFRLNFSYFWLLVLVVFIGRNSEKQANGKVAPLFCLGQNFHLYQIIIDSVLVLSEKFVNSSSLLSQPDLSRSLDGH